MIREIGVTLHTPKLDRVGSVHLPNVILTRGYIISDVSNDFIPSSELLLTDYLGLSY